MILRALDPTDAEAMAHLHATCFTNAWPTAEMATTLDVPGTLAMGLFELSLQGLVIARLGVDAADILTIAVAPTHRRLGYGQQLLEAIAEPLRRIGATTLMLEVAADNLAAQALYARLGAKQVGLRKEYYATPAGRMDALLLAWRLDLPAR